MAKTQITLGGGGVTYVRPNLMKVGEKISGTYLGSEEDRFEKLGHKVRASDGSLKIINGTGQLDALLERVTVGSEIDVTYKGKNKIENGQWKGTEAHTFEVYADRPVVNAPKVPDSKDGKFPF